MWTVLQKLHRTGLLTVGGMLSLVDSLLTTGINLLALLRVAARLHPERIALSDEQETLTYAELWRQSEAAAVALYRERGLRGGQKVAVACRNHAAGIKAIFAASRLGAHVYLLNPEMSADQFLALDQRQHFDLYVHDGVGVPPLGGPESRLKAELHPDVFAHPSLRSRALPAYHPTDASVDLMAKSRQPRQPLKKYKPGNIVVLTGGTTGVPKAASRQPSLFAFLPPFVALLCQVHLDNYRSVYIATPIYHGFGLAALIMSVVLGAEMHFTRRFDAAKSCAMIARNKVEVVTLVPLMLQRMLRHDSAALTSLRCIITGGAPLGPAVARETLDQLGPILFNFYGTSEAGFCIMAAPELLGRKPESIGQPVQGVRARIVDAADQVVPDTVVGDSGGKGVGRLCIRSSWTISGKGWIETGDLAYRDADGAIFLCGRVDDMVVSGGEKAYPIELENVLLQHPDVDAAAVIGIADAEFGQRMKAVVACKKDRPLDQETLLSWLKPRVARYQMPAVIEFRPELPYTALGKLDKKALRGL